MDGMLSFFFSSRRRHTRWNCDWSSDVCSSDLPIVTAGVCLVLAAYAAFAFAPRWVGAVIAGAVLLDCGLRSALVANQTLITSVAPDARSRFNTVFGAHIWGGNAVGAFLASTALAHYGWLAVCA